MNTTTNVTKDEKKHDQDVIDYYEGRVKKTMTPSHGNYLIHHVDRFLEITGIRPGDHVLDVGCGMGRYTLLLAERGVHVEGVDLSQYLLDRFQEFNAGKYKIPLFCDDILHFAEAHKTTYDAVVGFFTLHHFHDIAKCYQAMVKLVKPGGQISFLEPNAFNILYYFQIIFTPTMSWKGDGNMAKMRPGIIFPAMRTAGLTQLTQTKFGFFPPFVTNTRTGFGFERRLERFPLWYPLLPAVLFSGFRPLD